MNNAHRMMMIFLSCMAFSCAQAAQRPEVNGALARYHDKLNYLIYQGDVQGVEECLLAHKGMDLNTPTKIVIFNPYYSRSGISFELQEDSSYAPPLPLHVAAAQKKTNPAIINLLLKNGANINASCDGQTALFKAVDNNKIGMMRILLAQPAVDVNARCSKEFNRTPLMLAILRANPLAVMMLLADSRIDVTAVDDNGESVLDLMRGSRHARSNEGRKIIWLLEHPEDLALHSITYPIKQMKCQDELLKNKARKELEQAGLNVAVALFNRQLTGKSRELNRFRKRVEGVN